MRATTRASDEIDEFSKICSRTGRRRPETTRARGRLPPSTHPAEEDSSESAARSPGTASAASAASR
eukprot:1719-Pelagococcus_subviridis.AAC.1